jgi:hypothetical protein
MAGLLFCCGLLALPAPALAGTTRSECAGENGSQAILEVAADPLLTMRPVRFRLILHAPDGSRTTEPQLDCDLTMPAMAMPENRPRIEATTDEYLGEAVFTMAGRWEAEMTVRVADKAVDRLVFPVERVLLK